MKRIRFTAAIALAFLSVLFASPATASESPWWTDEVWENGEQTFTAPEGFVISEIRAWYGAPNDPTCGADVSAVLTSLVLGQDSTTVGLNNGTFGDPCGGVVKVTRYAVTLVPIFTELPPVVVEPEVVVVPVVVQPEPTPSPEPQPAPAPEPQPEPAPEPMPTPEPTPEPAPVEVAPAPLPAPPVLVAPAPPTIQPEPKPLPVVVSIVPAQEAPKPLAPTAPEDLTDSQVEELKSDAEATLQVAEQGSPEYEQALEALVLVAQADDVQLSEELAAIPLLGNVAGAALEAFNAIGNIGADMAPKVREQAEDAVVASVIVGQVASAAAASAAVSASSTRKLK